MASQILNYFVNIKGSTHEDLVSRQRELERLLSSNGFDYVLDVDISNMYGMEDFEEVKRDCQIVRQTIAEHGDFFKP